MIHIRLLFLMVSCLSNNIKDIFAYDYGVLSKPRAFEFGLGAFDKKKTPQRTSSKSRGKFWLMDDEDARKYNPLKEAHVNPFLDTVDIPEDRKKYYSNLLKYRQTPSRRMFQKNYNLSNQLNNSTVTNVTTSILHYFNTDKNKKLCYLYNKDQYFNVQVMDEACNALRNVSYQKDSIAIWSTIVTLYPERHIFYAGTTKVLVNFYNMLDSSNFIHIKYKLKYLTEFPIMYNSKVSRDLHWIKILMSNVLQYGTWSTIETKLILETTKTYTKSGYVGTTKIILHFINVHKRKKHPTIHMFQHIITEWMYTIKTTFGSENLQRIYEKISEHGFWFMYYPKLRMQIGYYTQFLNYDKGKQIINCRVKSIILHEIKRGEDGFVDDTFFRYYKYTKFINNTLYLYVPNSVTENDISMDVMYDNLHNYNLNWWKKIAIPVAQNTFYTFGVYTGADAPNYIPKGYEGTTRVLVNFIASAGTLKNNKNAITIQRRVVGILTDVDTHTVYTYYNKHYYYDEGFLNLIQYKIKIFSTWSTQIGHKGDISIVDFILEPTLYKTDKVLTYYRIYQETPNDEDNEDSVTITPYGNYTYKFGNILYNQAYIENLNDNLKQLGSAIRKHGRIFKYFTVTLDLKISSYEFFEINLIDHARVKLLLYENKGLYDDNWLKHLITNVAKYKSLSIIGSWIPARESIRIPRMLDWYSGTTLVIVKFFVQSPEENENTVNIRAEQKIKINEDLQYTYENLGSYDANWLHSIILNIKTFKTWVFYGSLIPQRDNGSVQYTNDRYTGTTLVRVHLKESVNGQIVNILARQEVLTEKQIYLNYANIGSYNEEWISNMISNVALYKTWSTIGFFKEGRKNPFFTYTRKWYTGTTLVVVQFYEYFHGNHIEISARQDIETVKQIYYHYNNVGTYNDTWVLQLMKNMEQYKGWSTIGKYLAKRDEINDKSLSQYAGTTLVVLHFEEYDQDDKTNIIARQVVYTEKQTYFYKNFGSYDDNWLKKLILNLKKYGKLSIVGSFIPERDAISQYYTEKGYLGSTLVKVYFQQSLSDGIIQIDARQKVLTDKQFYFYINHGTYDEKWLQNLGKLLNKFQTWEITGSLIPARDTMGATYTRLFYTGTTWVMVNFNAVSENDMNKIIARQAVITNSQTYFIYDNLGSYSDKWISNLFNKMFMYRTWSTIGSWISGRDILGITNTRMYYTGTTLVIIRFDQYGMNDLVEVTARQELFTQEQHFYYHNIRSYNNDWVKNLIINISKYKSWSTIGHQLIGEYGDIIKVDNMTQKGYTGSTQIMLHFQQYINNNIIEIIARQIVLTQKQTLYIYDNFGSYDEYWVNNLISNVSKHNTFSIIGSLIPQRNAKNVSYTAKWYTDTTVVIVKFKGRKKGNLIKIIPLQNVKTKPNKYFYENLGSYDDKWLQNMLKNIKLYKTWSTIGKFIDPRDPKSIDNTKKWYIGTTLVIVHFKEFYKNKLIIKARQQVVTDHLINYNYENFGTYDDKWVKNMISNVIQWKTWSTVGLRLAEREPIGISDTEKWYIGTTNVIVYFHQFMVDDNNAQIVGRQKIWTNKQVYYNYENFGTYDDSWIKILISNMVKYKNWSTVGKWLSTRKTFKNNLVLSSYFGTTLVILYFNEELLKDQVEITARQKILTQKSRYFYENFGSYDESWIKNLVRNMKKYKTLSVIGRLVPLRDTKSISYTKKGYTGTTTVILHFTWIYEANFIKIIARQEVKTEIIHDYGNLGSYDENWIKILIQNIKKYKRWSTIGSFVPGRDEVSVTYTRHLYTGTTIVMVYFEKLITDDIIKIYAIQDVHTQKQHYYSYENFASYDEKWINNMFSNIMEYKRWSTIGSFINARSELSSYTRQWYTGTTFVIIHFCEYPFDDMTLITVRQEVVTAKQSYYYYENLGSYDNHWLKNLITQMYKYNSWSTIGSWILTRVEEGQDDTKRTYIGTTLVILNFEEYSEEDVTKIIVRQEILTQARTSSILLKKITNEMRNIENLYNIHSATNLRSKLFIKYTQNITNSPRRSLEQNNVHGFNLQNYNHDVTRTESTILSTFNDNWPYNFKDRVRPNKNESGNTRKNYIAHDAKKSKPIIMFADNWTNHLKSGLKQDNGSYKADIKTINVYLRTYARNWPYMTGKILESNNSVFHNNLPKHSQNFTRSIKAYLYTPKIKLNQHKVNTEFVNPMNTHSHDLMYNSVEYNYESKSPSHYNTNSTGTTDAVSMSNNSDYISRQDTKMSHPSFKNYDQNGTSTFNRKLSRLRSLNILKENNVYYEENVINFPHNKSKNMRHLNVRNTNTQRKTITMMHKLASNQDSGSNGYYFGLGITSLLAMAGVGTGVFYYFKRKRPTNPQSCAFNSNVYHVRSQVAQDVISDFMVKIDL